MGSANKAFNGMVWSAIVNVVTAIYGFIAAPLLIRYFGRSEYGIIALATSVNAYMQLMDMGLSSTNVRFFSNWIAKGDIERVKKLMQTCTAFYGVIGIVNAVILVVISLFSAQIFNVSPEQDIVLKEMLWALSVIAIINWYTSCYGQLISATENVAWVQKRTLVTKLLMVLVVIATLTFKLSIIQYFLLTLVAGLVVLPATIRKVKREAPYISLRAKFDKNVFKEILPYSLNIFSFGIFQFTYNNLRPVILGMQGTIEAVTDHGVIASIAALVSMVGGVFIGALLPASSRIVANGDRENYYRVAYKGTYFVTIVLCFCAFGLMSVDEDLMMIYVGEDFMHLIPWLDIWLLLTITGNVSCISSLILAGTNIKPLTYSSFAASLSALVVCWFAVPYYQAGGAVIAMIVYNADQQLFYYIYYWPRILHINSWRIFVHTDMPLLILGGGLVLIIRYIPHFENHWINVLVFGISFALAYMAIVYLFMNKDDRNYVLNMIRRQ